MSIFSAIRSAAWMGAAALIAVNSTVAMAQSLTTEVEPDRIGQGEVRNGLFLQGNETYRLVDTAGFRTAADVESPEPGTVQPVGFHGGCLSCGTHSCRGGCGTASACGPCGSGPCGSGGHDYASGFADPCAPCNPFCYVSVEALYMDNDSLDGFTLSPHFVFGDEYSHEFGGRFTIGSVPDCVHGYEVTFTGPFEWDQAASITSAELGVPGLITTLIPNATDVFLNDFVASDLRGFANYDAVTLDAFNRVDGIVFDATEQRQAFEAEYWSIETNRTIFAGEYAKLLIGGRYINYDETYLFSSRTPAATGNLISSTDNDLYGLQIGMDLLFPVCCYGFADFRARFGGFINDAQNQFVLLNNTDLLVSNADDSTDLSGLIELSAGFRYQIGEILSVRAGTELWYLAEIASATGQFGNVYQRSSTGSRTRSNDDVLMTGVSVGAELRY